LASSVALYSFFNLEVGTLKSAKGSGERCKLASGFWGRAPAENEFDTL